MPAIIEHRTLDGLGARTCVLLPGRLVNFYTENDAGDVMRSFIIKCALTDRMTEVLEFDEPALTGRNVPDLERDLAKRRPKLNSVAQVEHEQLFATRLFDIDMGPHQLAVAHQAVFIPN